MSNFKKKSIVIVALGGSVIALVSCGVSGTSNTSTTPPPQQDSGFKPSGQQATSLSAYIDSTTKTPGPFLFIIGGMFSIMPNGGTAPYVLTSPSATSQLPNGFNFNPSSGAISVNPINGTKEGISTVIVADSKGNNATINFAIGETCPDLSSVSATPNGWTIKSEPYIDPNTNLPVIPAKYTETSFPQSPAKLTFVGATIVSSITVGGVSSPDMLNCGYHDSTNTSTPISTDFVIVVNNTSNHYTILNNNSWPSKPINTPSITATAFQCKSNIPTDCPFYQASTVSTN